MSPFIVSIQNSSVKSWDLAGPIGILVMPQHIRLLRRAAWVGIHPPLWNERHLSTHRFEHEAGLQEAEQARKSEAQAKRSAIVPAPVNMGDLRAVSGDGATTEDTRHQESVHERRPRHGVEWIETRMTRSSFRCESFAHPLRPICQQALRLLNSRQYQLSHI